MVAKCHAQKKAAAVIAVWVVTPVLLKPAFLFILFQQGNELSQKMCIIFHSYCLFKEQWSHNSFSSHCTPNMNLWWMRRISMQCTFIFSTPYSTVLTISISTYALSIKKTCSAHKPIFVKKWCKLQMCLLQQEGWRGQHLVCFASVFIHVYCI